MEMDQGDDDAKPAEQKQHIEDTKMKRQRFGALLARHRSRSATACAS